MRFVLILLLLFSAGADAARVAPTKHPERVHRNLRVTVYEGENPADESSVTYSTESNAGHAVLVLEGSPAYVEMGEAIREDSVSTGPFGTGVAPGYREVRRGFYVLPRLSGNRVTLQFSAFMDRPVSGNIELNRLSTKVSGKLGEWLEVMGSRESDTLSTESDKIWIRVDAP